MLCLRAALDGHGFRDVQKPQWEGDVRKPRCSRGTCRSRDALGGCAEAAMLPGDVRRPRWEGDVRKPRCSQVREQDSFLPTPTAVAWAPPSSSLSSRREGYVTGPSDAPTHSGLCHRKGPPAEATLPNLVSAEDQSKPAHDLCLGRRHHPYYHSGPQTHQPTIPEGHSSSIFRGHLLHKHLWTDNPNRTINACKILGNRRDQDRIFSHRSSLLHFTPRWCEFPVSSHSVWHQQNSKENVCYTSHTKVPSFVSSLILNP